MLGYKLGDINVRTAKILSDAISGGSNFQVDPYQQFLVQALYVSRGKTPASVPYTGPNGELIIEISDILDFLKELAARVEKFATSFGRARQTIATFLNEPTNISNFMADRSVRDTFTRIVRDFPPFYLNSQVEKFLETAWSPEWGLAQSNGGWGHYNTLLNALIDVFVKVDVAALHPSLFAFLAQKLATLAPYISPTNSFMRGYSYEATSTWHSRKSEFAANTIDKIKEFAINHSQTWLVPLVR